MQEPFPMGTNIRSRLGKPRTISNETTLANGEDSSNGSNSPSGSNWVVCFVQDANPKPVRIRKTLCIPLLYIRGGLTTLFLAIEKPFYEVLDTRGLFRNQVGVKFSLPYKNFHIQGNYPYRQWLNKGSKFWIVLTKQYYNVQKFPVYAWYKRDLPCFCSVLYLCLSVIFFFPSQGFWRLLLVLFLL